MSKVVLFPGNSEVFLRLPIPPSVNSAWRNVPGKGRVKTGIYKKWRNDALLCVAVMRGSSKPLSGPVSVSMAIRRPRKGADVDNRIKPVLDLLQAAAVIDDDKNVEEVTARWDETADGCEVTVKPFNSEIRD